MYKYVKRGIDLVMAVLLLIIFLNRFRSMEVAI